MKTDVARALAAAGVTAVSVEPLAGLSPVTGTARSFRVVSTDGTAFKVRLRRLGRQARHAGALAAALGDPRVPAPIAHLRGATIERWVDGEDLSKRPVEPHHVDDAARLLAAIHAFAGTPGAPLPQRRRTERLLAVTAAKLGDLVAARVLSATDAARLDALLRDALPRRAAWGLVHDDFCGENLVRTPEGVVVSIDNERLRRGFFDRDLARTWARWRVPAWAEARFLATYAASGHPPASGPARRAWRIVTATERVHVRHRYQSGVDEPLALLLGLLDG